MNDQIGENLSNWPEDYIKVAQENSLDVTSKVITKQNLLDFYLL